jgi:siroheme synthase-like protein
MHRYYPVALDLTARRCVVIGGGVVAQQKVRGLLDAGAHVVVISDAATASLDGLEAEGRVEILRRRYRHGDLRGAFLAIAADDRTDHPAIWKEADEERVLLNAVDDAQHCHFIAPAIHRQGDLTVAISTAGKSPALAVRLRSRIAGLIGPEYGTVLEMLGELRPAVAAREPNPARRTALWYRIVDSDVLARVRRGDASGARALLASLIRRGAGG